MVNSLLKQASRRSVSAKNADCAAANGAASAHTTNESQKRRDIAAPSSPKLQLSMASQERQRLEESCSERGDTVLPVADAPGSPTSASLPSANSLEIQILPQLRFDFALNLIV